MNIQEMFEQDAQSLHTDPITPVFQKRGENGSYALEHVEQAFSLYRLGYLRGKMESNKNS